MSTKKLAKKKAKRPARRVTAKQSLPISAAAMLGANVLPLASNICSFNGFSPVVSFGDSREEKLVGVIRRLADLL